MVIDNIEFFLKDGRRAVIRNATADDAQGMLDYLNISAGETEYILRYPEECSKYTLEGEKKLFEERNASPNAEMLVCEVDGEIAGNCEIAWSNKLKTRHRASVAIALISKYWGQGIGTKMFETLIRIAEGNPDILQMELEYVEGNNRARGLYEKMGFRITGIRPNGIRLKDGTLLNEYLMTREIKR